MVFLTQGGGQALGFVMSFAEIESMILGGGHE